MIFRKIKNLLLKRKFKKISNHSTLKMLRFYEQFRSTERTFYKVEKECPLILCSNVPDIVIQEIKKSCPYDLQDSEILDFLVKFYFIEMSISFPRLEVKNA